MSDPTAVVLLSGGMDSATATAIAKADGFEVIGLTIDYGQRHRKELDAAKSVAKYFGVKEHRLVRLDLTPIGGSALTDRRVPIPEGRPPEEIGTGIPPTYVPARNTIFLSYALALAEAVRAKAIYIAANSYDYAGYPDCRPEYYEADRKSTRLNSSHVSSSYAVFCLKKKRLRRPPRSYAAVAASRWPSPSTRRPVRIIRTQSCSFF